MFDPVTATAYHGAADAQARAAAVRDELGAGPLEVTLRSGAAIAYSGTFAGSQLVAGADGSLACDVVLGGVVTAAGTPDAATWTCRIANGAGRYIEDSFGPGGRFVYSGQLMAGQRVRLNIRIAPAGPPVSDLLPAKGFARQVSPSRAFQTVRPSDISADNFGSAEFGSFGGGVFNPYWSANGAWVMPVTGGHGHPTVFGTLLFDFDLDKLAWQYLPCPLLPNRNGPVLIADTTGAPWYDMPGTEIPGPPHPYKNLLVIPPSQGGGPKGDLVYLGRAAFCKEAYSVGTAHALNLHTNVWRRVATDPWNIASEEMATVHDPVFNRYYKFTRDLEQQQYAYWLDGATGTYQCSSQWPSYGPSLGGDGFGAWLQTGGGVRAIMLVKGGRIFALDGDAPGNGLTEVTRVGEAPADTHSEPVLHKQQNIVYQRLNEPRPQGQALKRWTPPPGNPITGTWTIDTMTLDGDAIPDYYATPYMDTQPYRSLVYVDALKMLGWVTANGVYLLNP